MAFFGMGTKDKTGMQYQIAQERKDKGLALGRKNRVKFRNKVKRKVNYKWIAFITAATFGIASAMAYFSVAFMESVSVTVALLILLLIISIGIFFDLLGIAVTAADETPFHSMAASHVGGSKESIQIIRNAGSVANFCNDVVGDIAGIISGSAAAAIIVKLALQDRFWLRTSEILLSAVIAAVTVGGKAVSKEIAMRHANFIVFQIGRLLHFFQRN